MQLMDVKGIKGDVDKSLTTTGFRGRAVAVGARTRGSNPTLLQWRLNGQGLVTDRNVLASFSRMNPTLLQQIYGSDFTSTTTSGENELPAGLYDPS